MREMYFVITSSEDGIDVQAFDADDLKKRLSEEHWGPDLEYHTQVPDISKGAWNDDAILIIKGRIIIPEAVQKITEYKLP